ncbi:MAG: hypothetical protein M5U26_18385 [Planctomycetota bacterium]|nr:hypothetical protein [Planctomycetota bacterium]
MAFLLSFALALLAFLHGLVTEYRQSKPEFGNAHLPTLPWAVAAALILALGLNFLEVEIEWWRQVLVFVVAVWMFGSAIIWIRRRAG